MRAHLISLHRSQRAGGVYEMSSRIARGSLALLALALGSACEKAEPAAETPVYGEPVGIQMEASKDLPAFEIAVAVSKGVTVDPLVAPLSGFIHKALRACPDFVKKASAAGEPTQVSFMVERGTTGTASVSSEAPGCMTTNLSAQAIQGVPPAKLHVIAMIRFPGAKGGDAGGQRP
jgi:hypothetical protein